MPQFFINKENIREDKIFITNSSDISHITNVLRHKKKDLLIFTGPENFVYEAEIISIKPDMIETKITDSYFSDKTLKTNITLAQSIIKSQKQDFLIQKATELGVARITPILACRTEKHLALASEKRVARWRRIALESAASTCAPTTRTPPTRVAPCSTRSSVPPSRRPCRRWTSPPARA